MSRSVDFAQLYPVVGLICATFERLRVTYLICGSVATYFQGHRARQTHDVDLRRYKARPRVAAVSGVQWAVLERRRTDNERGARPRQSLAGRRPDSQSAKHQFGLPPGADTTRRYLLSVTIIRGTVCSWFRNYTQR